MGILDSGIEKLFLIFVLGMVLVGPAKMIELAAQAGKMLGELQRATAELSDALNAELATAQAEKAAAVGGGNGHSQAASAGEAEVVAQGWLEADAAPGEAPSGVAVASAVVEASEVAETAWQAHPVAEAAPAESLEMAAPALDLPAVEMTALAAGPSSALASAVESPAGLDPLPSALLTPSTPG